MTAIPLNEARAKLPELIPALVPGEQVTITEHDLLVAQLVSISSPSSRREIGESCTGSVVYMDLGF